jgi:hypothetical protein
VHSYISMDQFFSNNVTQFYCLLFLKFFTFTFLCTNTFECFYGRSDLVPEFDAWALALRGVLSRHPGSHDRIFVSFRPTELFAVPSGFKSQLIVGQHLATHEIVFRQESNPYPSSVPEYQVWRGLLQFYRNVLFKQGVKQYLKIQVSVSDVGSRSKCRVIVYDTLVFFWVGIKPGCNGLEWLQ